ncbi:MAG TPA: FAD-binding protein [Clostridia bacterium]|nr:FAD-binding protein [Clostridia bacterium]
MNILVLFKTVPVWERVLEGDWERFSLHSDLSYAGTQFNCFDESALELGLRLKDEWKKFGRDARCFAVTAGTLHPSFAQTLFAAGYDDVASLGAEGIEFASGEVASLLARYAAQGEYELILAGGAAGMADTGTVPLSIAHELNRPLLVNAVELHAHGEALEALCQDGEGLWKHAVRLPLLVTIGNSPAVLRASTLRARLTHKDQEVRLVPVDYAARLNPKEIEFGRPAGKRACVHMEFSSMAEHAKKLLCEELKGKEHAPGVDSPGFCPENAVAYYTEGVPWYAAERAFGTLAEDWRKRKPDYALFLDDPMGRALAYRLANATGSFFLTGASFAEDGTSLARRACASNVVALHKPRVPAVLTMGKLPKTIESFSVDVENNGYPAWLLGEERLPHVCDGLGNKKIVVVCGAGIGSRANCELARTLAEKLGAGFGLTRAAALSGWGDPAEIVGQSGVSVSPEVCLVLGASGAGAFMVGIENAQRVIAVNCDENAPIFRNADVGVVADAQTLTHALLDAEGNA